jgi:hypothetical protein
MNARALVNVGLVVAVAAAAAVLYFKPQQAPQDSFPVVPVPLEQLQRIEITRSRSAPIVLERSAHVWKMKAPVEARVDEIAMGRVLDIARLRASNPLSVDNLSRFELDKPWAKMRFDQHAVEFGMTNGLTQELYLRSGNHVYAVPARMAAAVVAGPAKLLAHQLFGPDEKPVAFRLERFALRHDGTRWQLDPDDPGLSQDDLLRWVEQWRLAGSVVTQPRSSSPSAEKIMVELRDARVITFSVSARVPDLILQREDEALEYHLPARLAAVLLKSPSATAK